MNKIKRYIDCTVPIQVCNLKCSYCYLRQYNYDLSQKQEIYKYSKDTIRKALSKDRLGGVCYFMMVGIGETMADRETLEVFKALLSEGHVLDIVTNGTLTNRIKEMLAMVTEEECTRLKFTFSLHYLELKEKKLLDTFFANIAYVKEHGVSFHVVLNHSDIYLPYEEEIQRLCKEKLGAYPQLAYTHEMDENGILKICSELSREAYQRTGASYNSTLFEYQNKEWGKKRTEFCYAGDWCCTLNLGTGVMSKCHANGPYVDIFEDISKPIPTDPVGHYCASSTCQCVRFLAMGVVPGVCDDYTAESIMNRREAGWFTKEMQEALSTKLYDSNNYPYREKITGKNIVLYGAGKVGQSVKNDILQLNSNLVLWVDKETGKYEGVSEISAINDVIYDYIAVAIYDTKTYEQIKEMLLGLGVNEEKILWSRTRHE